MHWSMLRTMGLCIMQTELCRTAIQVEMKTMREEWGIYNMNFIENKGNNTIH